MIVDDLSGISMQELLAARDWQAKYRLIAQWGRLIQPKLEIRLEAHLIKGCEVSAWLTHDYKNSVHSFSFDSDSRVINGLAALLLIHIDKKTSAEINLFSAEALFETLGLEKHLTPSRNNGLRGMVKRVEELLVSVHPC